MTVIELKQLVPASLSPKPGAKAGDEPGRDWRGLSLSSATSNTCVRALFQEGSEVPRRWPWARHGDTRCPSTNGKGQHVPVLRRDIPW